MTWEEDDKKYFKKEQEQRKRLDKLLKETGVETFKKEQLKELSPFGSVVLGDHCYECKHLEIFHKAFKQKFFGLSKKVISIPCIELDENGKHCNCKHLVRIEELAKELSKKRDVVYNTLAKTNYRKAFMIKTKAKLGEIIYPHYNGTSGFLEKPRWDIVVGISKDGDIKEVLCTDDFATIRAIEIMRELKARKIG